MNHGRALFFGRDHTLFGWYHAPRNGSTREIAVLVCPPIGYENVCAHRALRHVTHDLVADGFATLRFDYYGTGDSAGADGEPSLVRRWQESIHAAADELRANSGCSSLALIGVRLGATLGALVAAERTDIETLVLWTPCLDGRSFLRETRLVGGAGSNADDSRSTSVDSSGFHFSAATTADLGRASLRQWSAPSVRRALIITRENMARDEQVAAQLRASLANGDARCDVRHMSNYGDFMVPPISSRLPVSTIRDITTWLRDTQRSARTHHHATVSAPSNTYAAREWVEEAIALPHDLFGVLTVPRGTVRGAVIVLNTGADPHVGPHRLYVPLAREWARLGLTTFRFDLRGVGDSGALRDDPEPPDVYPRTALDDVREAVAVVRDRYPTARIALAGMCAGGYHAVHATFDDVAAIVAVNPPLYYRRGDVLFAPPDEQRVRASHMRRSLVSSKKWRRLVRGDVDFRENIHVARSAVRRGARSVVAMLLRRRPVLFPQTRGVSLIFSATDAALRVFDESAGISLTELRARPNVTVDVVPDADHTFMSARNRRILGDLVTRRLLQHFGFAAFVDAILSAM